MYFELEWSEKETSRLKRVFHAWKAVKYMNMERRERKLPTMNQIQITVLNSYDGEFSAIVGSYAKDLQQDRYLAGTISSI